MAKRPFVRRLGELVDDYIDSDGTKTSHRMPGSMLGDEPSEGKRGGILEHVASGRGSISDLWRARTAKHLDALLAGLRNLDIMAPMALVGFKHDARVQPALVDAARRVSGEHLANFAQVVGMMGGPGAREVLRERLAELAADPQTFADNQFFNDKAGSLSTTACALLQLEPDADEAVDALLRLFAHPCAFNRRSAYMGATHLGSATLETEARGRLAAAIAPLFDTTDDDLFLAVCQALAGDRRAAVIERLVALLSHETASIRRRAVERLITLRLDERGPLTARARLEPALERLRVEPSLRVRVTIAARLTPIIPDPELEALVAETLADASPSLRYEGLWLLSRIERDAAMSIVRAALADEPDPALRRKLEAYIERDDHELPSFADVMKGFKHGLAEQLTLSEVGTCIDLGVAYEEMGLFADAIDMFEQALIMQPDHEGASARLAARRAKMRGSDPPDSEPPDEVA